MVGIGGVHSAGHHTGQGVGLPTLTTAVGAEFLGLMGTVTVVVDVPPQRPLTVMVTVSVVAEPPGPAAACMAVAVGV